MLDHCSFNEIREVYAKKYLDEKSNNSYITIEYPERSIPTHPCNLLAQLMKQIECFSYFCGELYKTNTL